jgi:UDP-N-acetylmuramoylalanine--D-glutamate ligase
VFACAALFIAGYDLSVFTDPLYSACLNKLAFDPHRVEHFLTRHGIEFYDDSKATIIQATEAACNFLAAKKRPIILIVGGTSKGVDRTLFIQKIAKHPAIKRILCFGKECSLFKECTSFATLHEVVHEVMKIASPGDSVLFSPSGASYDLFSNYQERGKSFKALVEQYDIGSR